MTKKLDKEHLDAIVNLQNEFGKNAAWIGRAIIEEKMLKQRLDEQEATIDQLYVEFEKLRNEEAKLLQTLKERYGDGEIDIENGTFTPYETEGL